MTLYLKRQIFIEASQQANGRDLVLSRGSLMKRLSGLDEMEEGGARKVALSIPSVDVDLMASGIALGKILYIETDTEITLKLSTTSDTGITVTPVDPDNNDLTEVPGTLYLEGEFTHVYVSVAGASGTANLVVGILGA